jgi:acetyl esterase/lipase/predicted acetyltransferase
MMENIPERVIEMRKAWAASDAKRDAGLKEPESVVKFRNISYGPYDQWNLLDVYRPVFRDEKKLPVIVNIHGGGYFYGDKELYRFYCMHLAEFGFNVVNLNYRLAPENKFPAPLEDILAVFKWISQNAVEYGMDKSRVFMVGDSAGAQLVSQFACIYSNKEYAKCFGFEVPEDVILKGVSLACGMYKIRTRFEDGNNEMMMDYFGSADLVDDPRTEILDNITADYPPAFVFSAANDFLVTECEPMAAYLRGKGIKAEYKIYGTKEDAEAGHVFHCNLRYPVGEEANRDQIGFFKSLCRLDSDQAVVDSGYIPEIIVADELSPSQKRDIRDIVIEVDKEFVPPLTERQGTTEKSSDVDNSKAVSDCIPYAYLDELLKQSFILVVDNNEVVGFLSYIKDYVLSIKDKQFLTDYISTIVVARKSRNKGLTQKMYNKLFTTRWGKIYSTRTWSTNDSNIHILKKFEFNLIESIKDDSGQGVDTVYYAKGL